MRLEQGQYQKPYYVERRELTRPQPWTKCYRQVKNAEKVKNKSPQERVPSWLFNTSGHSSNHIHTGNII